MGILVEDGLDFSPADGDGVDLIRLYDLLGGGLELRVLEDLLVCTFLF